MVFDTVREIIVEQLSIDEDMIGKDTNFEELGIDSLDIVELTMSLEEEFGIEITMTEDINTIGDLVDYIESKV